MLGRIYRDLDFAIGRLVERVHEATPIVEREMRCNRAYAGKLSYAFSDLLVLWRRPAPIHGAASAAIGAIQAPAPALRPGNHVEGGILSERTPGMPPGGARV